MKLTILDDSFSIVKLDTLSPIPSWALEGSWYSITHTQDELSIVCESRNVPENIKSVGPWRAFKVEGPLDFNLTGVLYNLTRPLAEAKISVFAISTFDTDYLLVRTKDFIAAKAILGLNQGVSSI